MLPDVPMTRCVPARRCKRPHRIGLPMFVVAVALLLDALSASARAQALGPDDMKRVRGPAVVRIMAQNTQRGFGVIVTTDGHVLTAAHVIAGLPDDAASASPTHENRAPRKLRVLFRDERPQADVAILKFEDGLGPGQTAVPSSLQTDMQALPFWNVKGSQGLREAIAAPAIPAVTTGSTFEFRGSINAGDSGSAVVNRFGHLIGIVVTGVRGDSTAFIRPITEIRSWFETNNVRLETPPPPPPRVAVYVDVRNDGSTGQSIALKVKVPLIRALSEMADYLRPASSAGSNAAADVVITTPMPHWSKVAEIVFDDGITDEAQRQKDVREYLNKPQPKAWLKDQNFSTLQLVIIGARDGGNMITLKPALIVIEDRGAEFELEIIPGRTGLLETSYDDKSVTAQ